MKTIYTTCTRDCPNTCGLTAYVDKGRLVRLTGSEAHPLTRGKACVKAGMYIERIYSSERVRYPMVRKSRQKGSWMRVTWDQALDAVAEQMQRIRQKDGSEAVLYYQGYGERTALKLLNRYFFNLFGGVTTLRGSLCGGTGQAAQNMDFGERISHDPLDHLHSNAMILWGRNPVSTNISLVPIVQTIRRRGGTVILVDPYQSRSAHLADRHIAPMAGQDVYLALAVAKWVLENNAEDHEFIKNHTNGFSTFKQIVKGYDLELLCRRAGVCQDDVIALARTFAERKPTATLLGWGLHRHQHAHDAIRAIDALAAISGNIGISGGGVSQGFEEYGPYDPHYWGDYLNPPRRTLLMPAIGDEIRKAVDPEIKMIFITAANPVCMAPDSLKVSRAFQKAEFVVYSGHFRDDTADHAHVFLPATTFLEEQDIMASYGHNYVGPVNKVIESVGECRSDFEMFNDLSRRFDFANQFCRTPNTWLYDICAPIREQGCTMEALAKGPFRLNAPMVPYEDRKFFTPSGQFEFMTVFDPRELNARDADFPYTLLSIAPHKYLNSERTRGDHPSLPVVRLNPEEAVQCGLKNGALVYVESRVGRIKALLQTDSGVRRDCLVTERGGWVKAGHGINRLTPATVSKVGLGTPYYDTQVKVSAC